MAVGINSRRLYVGVKTETKGLDMFRYNRFALDLEGARFNLVRRPVLA